jgi:hypothetical protein
MAAVFKRTALSSYLRPECEKRGQTIYLREGIAPPVTSFPRNPRITKKFFRLYTDALNQVCMTDEIPFCRILRITKFR